MVLATFKKTSFPASALGNFYSHFNIFIGLYPLPFSRTVQTLLKHKPTLAFIKSGVSDVTFITSIPICLILIVVSLRGDALCDSLSAWDVLSHFLDWQNGHGENVSNLHSKCQSFSYQRTPVQLLCFSFSVSSHSVFVTQRSCSGNWS